MLLYVVLLYYIYTLLYIGKRQRKTEERVNGKKTGRRMPPTSHQFLASPSAPSDVFTVHTIASRSPPRHRSTSNQKGSVSSCLSSCRLVLFPVSLPLPHVVRVGKSKRANGTGRERTRAKDAAAIFTSSSPLFCSVCCLHRPHPRPFFHSVFFCGSCYSSPWSRPLALVCSPSRLPVPRSPSCRLTAKPSPAAHYLTSSHHLQSGKGSPRPVLVVIPSPPPRHRPATGTGGPLPASPSPSVRW